MPDITMCTDKYCGNRDNCYRFKAEPDKYLQSYYAVSPRKDDQSCDSYWPIDKKEKKDGLVV